MSRRVRRLAVPRDSAILREHRRVEAGLQQAHVQKPTEQEVVIEFLAKARSLRTEYSEISSDALSSRSGGIDGRPPAPYISSKTGDSSARARSANCLITRGGWFGATRSSRSTTASIVVCRSRRPCIGAISLLAPD